MSQGTTAFVSGEAPTALPVEGVLNPNNERSELSGEALPALPVEGVLNPNNERSESERGGSTGFAGGGGAEPQ